MIDGLITSTDAARSTTSTNGILTVMKKEGRLRRGIFTVGKKDALEGLIAEIRMWH
jgi:hypothetical protein